MLVVSEVVAPGCGAVLLAPFSIYKTPSNVWIDPPTARAFIVEEITPLARAGDQWGMRIAVYNSSTYPSIFRAEVVLAANTAELQKPLDRVLENAQREAHNARAAAKGGARGVFVSVKPTKLAPSRIILCDPFGRPLPSRIVPSAGRPN